MIVINRRPVRNMARLGAVTLVALTMAGCGGSGSNGNNGTVTSSVATFAGSGESGTANGVGSAARFNNPVNVAVDGVGNVYVADFDNDRIRRISSTGVVSTLTSQANFQRPFGITLTPDGRLFVTTDANDTGARDATTGTLWQVNLSSGLATVVARNLGRPRGLAARSNTQLVLADITQNDVRFINPATGVITPLAGPVTPRGASGFVDGDGSAARFNRPYGVAVAPNGNILVADQNNNAIRLITATGTVTTFAGSSTPGLRNGPRGQALFNAPQDVDIDSRGIVYISDINNHRIRRVSAFGDVSNFAGDGVAGFQDGDGDQARFFGQEGLALNRPGNFIYVADGTGGEDLNFHRIRRITIR